MKKIFSLLFVVCFVIPFTLVSCNSNSNDDNTLCDICGVNPCVCVIAISHRVPYQDVNWSTFGQYKAAMHVHTTASDGSNPLNEMAETYYALDFDILAFTDHNYGRMASQTADVDADARKTFPLTRDWLQHDRDHREVPLNQERFNEITTGVGREGKKMIPVPNTSEVAVYPDEVNTFFFENKYEASVPGGVIGGSHIRNPIGLNVLLSEVEQSEKGLAFINHPGRTTGGAGRLTADGIRASGERGWVNAYTSLFNKYARTLGFEIVNRGTDNDSINDRILWDNVLKKVIPNGNRNIWGFANDDAHSSNGAGHAWNVFIMESNTAENLHEAMQKGNFYAVARRAQRELGATFYGGVPNATSSVPAAHLGEYPKITNITYPGSTFGTSNVQIRISVENADSIEWICDGEIIHTITNFSESFRLSNFTEKLLVVDEDGNLTGTYIRAQIKGPGGIAFTQPFPVKELLGIE